MGDLLLPLMADLARFVSTRARDFPGEPPTASYSKLHDDILYFQSCQTSKGFVSTRASDLPVDYPEMVSQSRPVFHHFLVTARSPPLSCCASFARAHSLNLSSINMLGTKEGRQEGTGVHTKEIRKEGSSERVNQEMTTVVSFPISAFVSFFGVNPVAEISKMLGLLQEWTGACASL